MNRILPFLNRSPVNALVSQHELIRQLVGKHLAEELTAERIARWLDSGQVTFVLDGFDEVPPSLRDEVCAWIVDLDAAARSCPLILTSRPLTSDHLNCLDQNWERFVMEPFDEPRIVDYIERWYSHISLLSDEERQVDAAGLASRWRDDPTVDPLTGNPLMLSTLLMVHHLDGDLPSGRSQLYRRYVDGMLGLWDERRKVAASTVQLSREQKRQIMRGLALHMFLQEQDQLDEVCITNVLSELLRNFSLSFPADDVLAAFRERSGLIVGPGVYSFVHKTVAEYLVAEAVYQGDQRDSFGRKIDRLTLLEHHKDDRWNTVIFLWAGLVPIGDLEAFIDMCNSTGAPDLAYGLLRDQYERVPSETRRRLVKEGLLGKWDLDRGRPSTIRVYRLFSSHPVLDKDCDIFGWLRIRSLTYDSYGASFNTLLDRAIEDGIVEWSDARDVHRPMWDVAWINFVTQVRTEEEWRSVLATPCPDGARSMAWLCWAIYAMASRAVQGRVDLDLVSIAEGFCQAQPQAKGLLPIVMMAVGVDVISALTASPEPVSMGLEHIEGILGLVSKYDDVDGIPEDWLLGTEQWDAFPSEGGRLTDDLLLVFVNQLEELGNRGVLERTSTYEQAVGFVEALKRRRAMLDAKRPDSEKSTSRRRLRPPREAS